MALPKRRYLADLALPALELPDHELLPVPAGAVAEPAIPEGVAAWLAEHCGGTPDGPGGVT